MFDFGTASFSIPRGGGCSAGDIGLERVGALARPELCAEEGGALIGWIGAGEVDALAGGPMTARTCPGGACAGRAGGGKAAAVTGRAFVASEAAGCGAPRRAGFSAECTDSLALRAV
jgi:hypothetical protein